MSSKQLGRSVEDVIKEVLALEHEVDEDDNWISTDEDIANIVRFVVQAERQRCEEMVEAERERIKDLLPELDDNVRSPHSRI